MNILDNMSYRIFTNDFKNKIPAILFGIGIFILLVVLSFYVDLNMIFPYASIFDDMRESEELKRIFWIFVGIIGFVGIIAYYQLRH